MKGKSQAVAAVLTLATGWAFGAYAELTVEPQDGLQLHFETDGRVVDHQDLAEQGMGFVVAKVCAHRDLEGVPEEPGFAIAVNRRIVAIQSAVGRKKT